MAGAFVQKCFVAFSEPPRLTFQPPFDAGTTCCVIFAIFTSNLLCYDYNCCFEYSQIDLSLLRENNLCLKGRDMMRLCKEENKSEWERSVFINCPYDKQYLPLLRQLIFVLCVMGFSVKLAQDEKNNIVSRMNKIESLIDECKYSIHDISYMQSTKRKEFARMNMPFELGIDYGYRTYVNKEKQFLILESKKYNSHYALSDLSGMDIECHNNKEIDAIGCITDWVSGFSGVIIPSKKAYWDLYYNDFLWYVYNNKDKWCLDEDSIFNSITTLKLIVPIFVDNLPEEKKEKYNVIDKYLKKK